MKNPLRKRKLTKSKGEEGYGDCKVTIDFGDDELLDEEAMVEKLMACLTAPDYRPPTAPSVVVDLLRLSQQPDVDFDDVVKVLEQDRHHGAVAAAQYHAGPPLQDDLQVHRHRG